MNTELFFAPTTDYILKRYINPVFIPFIINIYIARIRHWIGHVHFNNCGQRNCVTDN